MCPILVPLPGLRKQWAVSEQRKGGPLGWMLPVKGEAGSTQAPETAAGGSHPGLVFSKGQFSLLCCYLGIKVSAQGKTMSPNLQS